jgi:hypothetical protein
VVFTTNNTERMRLTAAGLLGLGTSTPRGDVSIGHPFSSAFDASLHLGYAALDYYGFRLVNTNTASLSAAGLLKFQRGTTTAWVDSVVIDNNGNVGIGTTGPTALLELSGSGIVFKANTTTTTSTSTSIQIGGLTTTSNSGCFLKSYTNLGSTLNSQLSFEVNGGALEAARIDSSGRLLVGTSTAVSGADIQAASSVSVGGLQKIEFAKQLGLADNTETTYLTFSVPGGGAFTHSVNIGAEISYVITTNRETSSRISNSTFGKVYVAIDRHWETSADNPVAVNLVDTDKDLCTSSGSAPTITWSASVESGIDNSAKAVYIKVTVDNPNAGSIVTAITGTVTYHTRATGSTAITVS